MDAKSIEFVKDYVNELLSHVFAFPCPTHRPAHEEHSFFVSERDRPFLAERLQIANLQSRDRSCIHSRDE